MRPDGSHPRGVQLRFRACAQADSSWSQFGHCADPREHGSAELIAMCPRRAGRPAPVRCKSLRDGSVSRLPLPRWHLRTRGESRSMARSSRAGAPAARCRSNWAHSTSGGVATCGTQAAGQPLPGSHEPVWWPVFGRLTASPDSPLRTGSQSRAIDEGGPSAARVHTPRGGRAQRSLDGETGGVRRGPGL